MATRDEDSRSRVACVVVERSPSWNRRVTTTTEEVGRLRTVRTHTSTSSRGRRLARRTMGRRTSRYRRTTRSSRQRRRPRGRRIRSARRPPEHRVNTPSSRPHQSSSDPYWGPRCQLLWDQVNALWAAVALERVRTPDHNRTDGRIDNDHLLALTQAMFRRLPDGTLLGTPDVLRYEVRHGGGPHFNKV